MAFQSGLTPISNGATSVTVTFAEPFDAPPQLVIPLVQNVDGLTQITVANVTAVSETAFTVALSAATDSADYELAWAAGDLAAVFEVITQGIRITDLGDAPSLPRDTDRIPLLFWNSPIRTTLLSWLTLRSHFPNLRTIPGNPHTAGQAGDMAMPSSLSPYLFLHNGLRWGRIPVDQDTAWTGETVLTPFREGVVNLANAATVHVVTFSEPFSNSVADADILVQAQLFNVVDNPVTILFGMITARSISGFTFVTNAPTTGGNFKLSYSARVNTHI